MNALKILKLQETPGDYFTVIQIGLNAVAILGGIVGEGILSPYITNLLKDYTNIGVATIVNWPLCQGQLKKECKLMKPKDDFCIEQESSFLSSIDIFHYCNISYIFLLLFLHLLGFYKWLIQSHLSCGQRKIP